MLVLELDDEEEEVEEAEGGVCGVREEDDAEPEEPYPLVELELLAPLLADEEDAADELEDEGV